MPPTYLRAPRVLTDTARSLAECPEATLVIEQGLIAAILPGRHPGHGDDLPIGSILAPGFVDAQVNGGGGILYNDAPTTAAALAIARAHRRFGTTSIFPTLITDVPARMHEAAATIADAVATPRGGVAGLHLEGPFLSPDRPGVHDSSLIRGITDADRSLLAGLAARIPLLLTLAPEHVGNADLQAFAAAGIRLSAGHSAASHERVTEALAHGITGFTHWPNAMPAFAGRAPGIMAAALADPASWAGIIVDGHHVHPATLRLLLATKPQGRVFLVSDAMSPTGTGQTRFTLNGRTIHRRGGRLETDDGTLAGADLDMAQAVRNTVALGQDPAAALRMAATIPAAFLRLPDRGRIAPGLRADLVLLTADLHPIGTWLAGQWRPSTRP